MVASERRLDLSCAQRLKYVHLVRTRPVECRLQRQIRTIPLSVQTLFNRHAVLYLSHATSKGSIIDNLLHILR